MSIRASVVRRTVGGTYALDVPCCDVEKDPLGRRILSALPALFLLVDAIMKLVKPAPVVTATVALGYPESVILPLGIVLLICTVLYLIPRTAVLGAILLTGYLGGAVATHVRI